MSIHTLSYRLAQLAQLALFALLFAAAPRAEPASSLATQFGSSPAMWNVRLSPDGSQISYLTSHSSGVPIAVVWKLEGGEPQVVLASQEDGARLSWCDWANNERLLCGYLGVLKFWEYRFPKSALLAVNADGSDKRVLMPRRARQRTVFAQFQDQVVDWLPDDPKHVLIEAPGKAPALGGVQGLGVTKINIYTSATETVERARDTVYWWMSDGRGAIRLKFSHLRQRRTEWHYRGAGEKKWQLLHRHELSDLRDSYYPEGFGSDSDKLLVVTPFEGKLALWSEDMANERARALVFAHPDVDVSGGLYVGKYHRMVAARYATDSDHLHFFDEQLKRISDRLSTAFPEQIVRVVDESWDQRYFLVYVSQAGFPGSYFRFDAEDSVLAKISLEHPQLEGVSLAETRPVQYRSRDGEQLVGYLTLPPSATNEPLPAVILPHGEWNERGYWSRHWLAQYLAARGYAVLQTTYRGSRGLDWWASGGYRSWRVVIADLSAGARHLVEQGVVDGDRICIVGHDSGGYSALLSAVEEPALYRCAVSIAGVSDLAKYLEKTRGRWHDAVKELVGDDAEERRAGSPAKRAAEFAAPVLLFHGEEDGYVLIEQSRRMASALRSNKKAFELIEYEHAGHRIRRDEDRIDMLTRIGAFLDQNTAPVAKLASDTIP